jgi:hypothetical protein
MFAFSLGPSGLARTGLHSNAPSPGRGRASSTWHGQFVKGSPSIGKGSASPWRGPRRSSGASVRSSGGSRVLVTPARRWQTCPFVSGAALFARRTRIVVGTGRPIEGAELPFVRRDDSSSGRLSSSMGMPGRSFVRVAASMGKRASPDGNATLRSGRAFARRADTTLRSGAQPCLREPRRFVFVARSFAEEARTFVLERGSSSRTTRPSIAQNVRPFISGSGSMGRRASPLWKPALRSGDAALRSGDAALRSFRAPLRRFEASLRSGAGRFVGQKRPFVEVAFRFDREAPHSVLPGGETECALASRKNRLARDPFPILAGNPG